VVCPYSKYYLTIKKLIIDTQIWVYHKMIMLSERSQTFGMVSALYNSRKCSSDRRQIGSHLGMG
jgi:hypothetical protein